MSIKKFETDIKCNGCIETVTPHLNEIKGIKSWEVDTESEKKILRVETDTTTDKQIMKAVKAAGFKIKPIRVNFLHKFFN